MTVSPSIRYKWTYNTFESDEEKELVFLKDIRHIIRREITRRSEGSFLLYEGDSEAYVI